jgi:hypothetical protein
MQGQYNHRAAYYRCRYPKEYALASHVRHPGNVYLREADVLPAIDRWLTVIFAPRRLTQTIAEIQAAQAPTFKPGEANLRAEVTIGPENYVEHAEQCADTGRVRGGPTPYPHIAL